MSRKFLESLGAEFKPNLLYTGMTVPGEYVTDRKEITSVFSREAYLLAYRRKKASMSADIMYIIVIAVIIGVIVMYNLGIMSFTEKTREIATLKVLGFYQNETAQYVFRENMILTAIATLFGIPMGIALLRYVMAQVVIKNMYFGCRLAPLSYVYSIVLTFLFAVLINLALRRKIDKIDMAESMKAIE